MESRFRGALPLLAIIVPIIAVAFVATRLHDFPAIRAAVGTMRSGADEWWAVPLFVVLYALFTVFLLPVTPLSAAAALTWGWAVGGTVELVTCTFTALVPFALARRGLTGWIARRVPREHIPEAPFTLFLLRLVPVVPFVALNYLAGTTRVRARDYVVTTFFGSIPSVFLFAWFIDTMAGAALGVVEHATIIAACVAVAAVALVARFVARRFARLS
jgi:uncharacterized membrane protein YdjX (TVP38/TMEM64 family)